VIEAESTQREAALLLLDSHVCARKDRRRESDESRERHEEHVERVDEELPVGDEQRARDDHAHSQRDGRRESEKAESDVDGRSLPALAEDSEHHGARERKAEDCEDLDHSRPPRGCGIT
jgi:hypothetical protein